MAGVAGESWGRPTRKPLRPFRRFNPSPEMMHLTDREIFKATAPPQWMTLAG
jgi:hypothetical protein